MTRTLLAGMVLAGLIAVLMFAGCASTPAQRPAAKIADYGTRVMSSVVIIEQAASAFHDAGMLSRQQTGELMIICYRIGQTGEQLAAALQAYDQAPAQGSAIKVGAILSLIEAQLDTLARTYLGSQAAEQLGKLVANVRAVIRAIQAAVPMLAPLPSGA